MSSHARCLVPRISGLALTAAPATGCTAEGPPVLLVAFIVAFMTLIVALVVLILFFGRRKTRRLYDAAGDAFAAMGTVERTGGRGLHRRWGGTLPDGRPIYIQVDQGPTWLLRVDADVHTRASAHRDNALTRRVGVRKEHRVPVPGRPKLWVDAYEQAWAEAFVASPDVAENLETLLRTGDGGLHRVDIHPGAVALGIRYGDLVPFGADRAQDIGRALSRLAERVESLPVEERLESGPLGAKLARDPAGFRRAVLAVALVGSVLLALLVAVAVILPVVLLR
jgi:hypothetical protein